MVRELPCSSSASLLVLRSDLSALSARHDVAQAVARRARAVDSRPAMQLTARCKRASSSEPKLDILQAADEPELLSCRPLLVSRSRSKLVGVLRRSGTSRRRSGRYSSPSALARLRDIHRSSRLQVPALAHGQARHSRPRAPRPSAPLARTLLEPRHVHVSGLKLAKERTAPTDLVAQHLVELALNRRGRRRACRGWLGAVGRRGSRRPRRTHRGRPSRSGETRRILTTTGDAELAVRQQRVVSALSRSRRAPKRAERGGESERADVDLEQTPTTTTRTKRVTLSLCSASSQPPKSCMHCSTPSCTQQRPTRCAGLTSPPPPPVAPRPHKHSPATRRTRPLARRWSLEQP